MQVLGQLVEDMRVEFLIQNFNISKKQYILSSNEGKNTLHGGKTGFSKLPVENNIIQTKDKIVYQLYSPDN